MIENKSPRFPTATEYAYDHIKELILSGNLAPGERIKLDLLTEEMGISRIPIKSAIDKLSAEGLVEDVPRRGKTVTPVSYNILNGLFNMRCALEPIALLQAIDCITPEDIVRLLAKLDSQDKAATDSNLVMQANSGFHFALYALSQDEALIKVLDNLWVQSRRYREIYYKRAVYNDRVIKEHYELLDLIANRKKQEAVDFLIEHTRRSQSLISEMLFGEKVKPLNFKFVAQP